MIKKFVLLFILFSFSQSFSQSFNKAQLDSLYNLFTFIRGINTSDKLLKMVDENPAIKKCGMALVNDLKRNLQYFSSDQQNVLSKLLSRPELPKSLISPGGFFKIHYTTEGNDAIGYDVNLLAQALDSAYNFEVNYLGFLPPPSDGSEGGDGKYDVYVSNIGGIYGVTYFESMVASSNWQSYMDIHCNFNGFYTEGIDAARVTVAHEFHHAIQSGSYAPVSPAEPFRNSDLFFYELTSTAFEEFVFDTVNDYYAYMPDYFNHPENPLSVQNGYNIAIWNLYLQKRFGFEVIKRQWQLIPQNQALKAIALSINEVGSTFETELNKFGIWTYFTKTRAIEGSYFEEAANYPAIKITSTVDFNSSSQTYNMSMYPTANYFLKINLPSSDGIFNTIITNADWQKALNSGNEIVEFSYSIFSDTVSGEKNIDNKYSVSFSRDNQQFWGNAGILNDIVVYGDSSIYIPEIEDETFAFPSPFRYSVSESISLVFLSDEQSGKAIDLNIFSAGLQLAYTGKPIIKKSFIKESKRYCEIIWNGLDEDNKHLGSGIYIYVIKSGDEVYKGKLVIFND